MDGSTDKPQEGTEGVPELRQAADATHDWFVPDFIGYECCRKCGPAGSDGGKMTGWEMIAGEGARLKRQQLEREICALPAGVARDNLLHTFSKLFMFLEDDIRAAMREAARSPYT